jgi:Na+/phosphate symporter
MIDLLALIVCVVGGVAYIIAKDSKRAQLGLYAFGAGLLVFLFKFSGAIYPLVR